MILFIFASDRSYHFIIVCACNRLRMSFTLQEMLEKQQPDALYSWRLCYRTLLQLRQWHLQRFIVPSA